MIIRFIKDTIAKLLIPEIKKTPPKDEIILLLL